MSRPDGTSPALQATWDLDFVVAAREWKLQLPEPDADCRDILDEVTAGRAGTVVIWDKIDRLFSREYTDPAGTYARNALDRQKKRLFEHIGMVYQRFLDRTDDRARNIEIRLDGDVVEPWNPYCEGLSTLVAEEVQPVELENGSEASFHVRAFVLPRREEFPDEHAYKRARVTNDRQGIYIYREQRLIHDADWLNMFQKEPHASLLRVEFSFLHDLDDAFHVDIKKSRIRLNAELWNWLRDEFLPTPRRAAQQSYRKGRRRIIQDKSKGAHESSNRSIAAKESELHTANINVLNPASGDVEVTNPKGTVRLKLKVSSALIPGQCFVEPAESIDDGMLWEPCIIDGHKAVRINSGHPYYHKVYVPNLASGVTVQGMDSLLWALCSAELGTINEATARTFLGIAI